MRNDLQRPKLEETVKALAKELLELCTTLPQMREPVEIAVRRKLPIDKKYAGPSEGDESYSSCSEGSCEEIHRI